MSLLTEPVKLELTINGTTRHILLSEPDESTLEMAVALLAKAIWLDVTEPLTAPLDAAQSQAIDNMDINKFFESDRELHRLSYAAVFKGEKYESHT